VIAAIPALSKALAPESGLLDNAAFAQKTFSETFSADGTFAGQTVSDVATSLRAGELTPADVPVQYIVRDGDTLILNTRSEQALEQAGIPRSHTKGLLA
jgi:filamentous hemagglutinin